MISHKAKRLILLFLLLLSGAQDIYAETKQQPFNVYLFWAEGCPHCANEIHFIKQWVITEPRVLVHTYEVTQDAANRELYSALVQYFGIQRPAVPFLVIGGRYIQGFNDAATTGEAIKAAVSECLKTSCGDLVHWLKTGEGW